MSRLYISHRTRYEYNNRVSTSYNEARMTPLTDASQVTLESSITITPQQATALAYRDYWGARVTTFDIHVPHDALEVLATATVEVHRSPEDPFGDDAGDLVSWDQLESLETIHEFSDFLPQTRLSTLTEEGAEQVRRLRTGDPNSTAKAIIDWLAETMTYQPGVTSVQFGAAEALASGQGVCQDLAHIGIGALRSLGIPARYVSGYIHPRPDAPLREKVSGQSHAWLEWWDGSWHSWDPTNHKPAGELHVLVGRGRDYRDVTPLKGIVSGGGGSVLSVEVLITRYA